MAFTPVIPTSMSVTMSQGLRQEFVSGIVTNMSGAPQDLSAWTSLTATIVANQPGPNTADATFGTVTASAGGVLTLITAAADLASVTPGTATLVISGKPTSGDDAQILSRGTFNLQAA